MCKDELIYIACPGNVVTGGPESLHQLGFELKKNNLNIMMYYYNIKKEELIIPEKFRKYNLPYVTEIEDTSKNKIIIPEADTWLLYEFQYINKIIWWLSVDFYQLSFIKYQTIHGMNRKLIPNIVQPLLYPLLYPYFYLKLKKNRRKRYLRFDRDKNINKYYHLYNCQYCLDFLLKNGVIEENTHYLCGPLSKDFILDSHRELTKENIVTYNPKKGLTYTKKIIEYVTSRNNRIKFRPIVNMSSKEVIDLLKASKIYIDFGFFPGPERIPREAVLNRCNIITSRLGSAQNNIDVPIPSKYKFDTTLENIPQIGEKIIEMIENYEEQIEDFDLYRAKVYNQPEIFERSIREIFLSENKKNY